jgi:hypothetical protein
MSNGFVTRACPSPLSLPRLAPERQAAGNRGVQPLPHVPHASRCPLPRLPRLSLPRLCLPAAAPPQAGLAPVCLERFPRQRLTLRLPLCEAPTVLAPFLPLVFVLAVRCWEEAGVCCREEAQQLAAP